MTTVQKPVLLRRLLDLSCRYSGQILSYTKMLGQLHDAGNTTTLAHYLDLLAGAGMVAGIQKFAGEAVRTRVAHVRCSWARGACPWVSSCRVPSKTGWAGERPLHRVRRREGRKQDPPGTV
jgi:hypothetical protein